MLVAVPRVRRMRDFASPRAVSVTLAARRRCTMRPCPPSPNDRRSRSSRSSRCLAPAYAQRRPAAFSVTSTRPPAAPSRRTPPRPPHGRWPTRSQPSIRRVRCAPSHPVAPAVVGRHVPSQNHQVRATRCRHLLEDRVAQHVHRPPGSWMNRWTSTTPPPPNWNVCRASDLHSPNASSLGANDTVLSNRRSRSVTFPALVSRRRPCLNRW